MSKSVPGPLEKQPSCCRYPVKKLLSISTTFLWHWEKQTWIFQDRVRKYNEYPFMPVPVKYFWPKKQEADVI